MLRGEVAGVPSAHVVRLSSLGTVSVEGPVGAGGRPIIRAAQLLETLLPSSDAGPQFRIPGGLKLVVARALGTIDLPPYESLEVFAEALSRFAATDASAAISNLVVSWADAVASRPDTGEAAESSAAPPAIADVQPFVAPRATDARTSAEPLTVSDIRRARRATGLPLATVAERSRIPVSLLRQLEWGYLFNWPEGHYGRTQLVRYARGAGLDEQLVIATIAPLLRDLDRSAAPPAAREERPLAVRPVPVALTVGQTLPVQTATEARRARRSRMLAALAIPALIALAVLPAWWSVSLRNRPAVQQTEAAVTSPAATPPPSPLATTPSTTTTAQAAVDTEDPPPAAAAPPEAVITPEVVDGAPAPVPTSGVQRAGNYQLASASEEIYSPSFAAAGTAVFYHAQGAGRSSLHRADTDGDGSVLRITRIVDDAANNYHVRPSPDGNRIAFDSDRDGVRGVYVANSDGTEVRRVSPEGYAAVPSWSPDSRKLAFVRESRPKVWNLWTLDLASGDLRQITNHRYGQPWGGSWFPDGRRIAYSHEDRLVIRDLESGRERSFATPVKGHLVRTPAVSPEGRRIVFQVHRSGTWLLELPGGAMRKILDDPSAEEYTWAPDGKRVAYHSRQSGTWGVWVMAPRDR